MEASAGSFGSAVLYYGFAFLMVVWMCIKIARGSVVLAVLTFVFWPLALLSLLRNWRDPQTDIRIPFFAAVAALGMSLFMVQRSADQLVVDAAPHFSDEELTLIQQSNPDAYAKVMQARADYEASGARQLYADEGDAVAPRPAPADSTGRGSDSRAQTAPGSRIGNAAVAEQSPPAAPLDPLLDLAQTAAGLSYQYSQVGWPSLQAQLRLPPRFRFIAANRLHRIARLRSQPLPGGGLGWISHETVDLGQPEAWVVEVRHLAVGRFAEGDLGDSGADLSGVLAGMAGAPVLDGSSRTLGSGVFAPQWDDTRGLLTWAVESPEGLSEHHAALPMRQGALLFSVRGLQPDQRELGLRVTRLLAASVEVSVGARWRDQPRRGDVPASVDLLQWVQGRQPASTTGEPPGA
jgi:hypothetical protein